MNRRDFLRRSALIAAGVVAADQLELLERLAHRRVFAGWSPTLYERIDFPLCESSTHYTPAIHRKPVVSLYEGRKWKRIPPGRVVEMGDGRYRVSLDTHEPGPILLYATAEDCDPVSEFVRFG